MDDISITHLCQLQGHSMNLDAMEHLPRVKTSDCVGWC